MLPPLSHLYPHLRIHQIFGANTDVGKTIFTTALALASSALPLDGVGRQDVGLRSDGQLAYGRGEKVHYVKPISTGPLRDSDSLHISRYLPSADAHTLFQFNDPVSPHVAAARFKTQASGEDAARDTSDASVLHTLSDRLSQFAHSDADRAAAAYIETAGGVHSPAPSGSSFSSLLRPLRLPTVLIGDSNLGGISTTKSAYDSLILAGYDVEALLLFSDAGRGWENAAYLRKWGEEIGLPVWALAGPSTESGSWGPPPARVGSIEEDQARMQTYYTGLVRGRGEQAGAYDDESTDGIIPAVRHLRQKHRTRIQDLQSMAARTRESCWWPFSQHNLAKTDADVNVIDSAYGDFFTVVKPVRHGSAARSSILQPLLDGSASWWTQCLGHADPGLTRAAARAAGRYGHVLFPMCANEPALRLSETLTGKAAGQTSGRIAGTAPGQGWASRVFFSDDGSTGMEVALKMAISSSAARYAPAAQSAETEERIQTGRQPGYQAGRPTREWKVLGLKGSYHGDTIGAMDACEDNVYNKRVNWYRGRGTWFEPATVSIEGGENVVRLPLQDPDWTSLTGTTGETHAFPSMAAIYDVEGRLKNDKLAGTYRKLIFDWLDQATRVRGERYGALVLEPLIMGAGGMICIDPLFQRCLVDVVRQNPDLFGQSDPPLRRPSHVRSPSLEQCRQTGDWRGLPVIFDEVFTGLYRLGYATPAHALGVNPDISVLAKILTGGMVPMSVTLATKSIFDTFAVSDQKADALLHGHSYTAHPIGCEVANETLRRIEQMRTDGKWDRAMADWSGETKSTTGAPWSFWSQDAVRSLSHSPRTESTMALGTVLIVKLKDLAGQSGYTSTAAADLLQELRTTEEVGDGHNLAFNIHARPLGNVIYIMSSLNTPSVVLRKVEDALSRWLAA